jgi:choline dehydrogenase
MLCFATEKQPRPCDISAKLSHLVCENGTSSSRLQRFTLRPAFCRRAIDMNARPPSSTRTVVDCLSTIDMHDREKAEYDYIVVGSGAGGGPVAANLANAGMRVLLLEAGGDAEPADYQVPCFHAFASEDPSLRWNYFVRHYADDARQRRDEKFVAERDGVLYPRAGTLGGCTAHNAMITIYPHNDDWNEIVKVTGDQSWRPDNMQKYFRRLEGCRYRWLDRLLSLFGWNPTRHGYRGWLCTEVAIPLATLGDARLVDVLTEYALSTVESLSHSLGTLKRDIFGWGDPNDWQLVKDDFEGLCFTPLATDNHARTGTREFLKASEKAHPRNLTIATNCLATEVLFDGKAAIGVRYLQGAHLYEADAAYDAGNSATQRAAYAKNEIILSCGAFNTPQLLMLSGIGPADHLQEHGITPRVNLPGVGANLQDRYEVGVVNRMKRDWEILQGANFDTEDPLYAQWAASRDGLYTSNGAVLGIAKKSSPEQSLPDLFMFALLAKFSGYYPGYSRQIADHHDYLTWAILKAHTRNTAGRVTLRSADPRAMPAVDFHYFDEGTDVEGADLDAVVAGVKFVRGLQKPLSDAIAEEELPGANVVSDDDLRDFVKDNAWGHHASCTCKIGAPSDRGAVLDSNFKVYGTENLRVVDASVFPKIPGFFIVVPVYMIAEKASEVILADAKRTAPARSFFRRK